MKAVQMLILHLKSGAIIGHGISPVKEPGSDHVSMA